jgi:hypothetical protein
LNEVKALLQTFEDGGNWTMEPQEPLGAPRRQKPAQGGLF